MTMKVSLMDRLGSMLKEFINDVAVKEQAKIVDIYECKKSGYIRAVIQLSTRHVIEKNISDIVTDNMLIQCFDKKTIRTLTYMATIERMKPDYSVVVQQLQDEVDEYILGIKSKSDKNIIKKTPSEISKDKALLAKFSPVDASRIGYLAGIRDTVKEFKIKSTINCIK
ncbi:MAG: hypothetical protein H0W64_04945 [Gammaproteobacteria bacterium]|nr:hypothetical protein [Gammaproteobacteria bacterium]